MTDDWTHIKARLEQYLSGFDEPYVLADDIRAALRRIERDDAGAVAGRDENARLRQRVATLEQHVSQLQEMLYAEEVKRER